MVHENATILVTGATGSTGAEVARQTLATGTPVRAMIRRSGDENRLPAGAEPVVGDFDDPASITTALHGIRRCYLVTPSSESAERQQLDFVQRAGETGVERIVLLSQLGADERSPVRFLRYHAVVENAIIRTGLGYTFLRPNLFFQGLLGFAGQIQASGVLAAPIGDAAVSAVDVRDIGAVGAAALTQDGHANATYTVTGPESLTHADFAAAISAATGTSVRFADAPSDQFAAAAATFLPPWQVDGLIEDYAHYRRGEASAVSNTVEAVTGRPARRFAEFARDHAEAFGGRTLVR